MSGVFAPLNPERDVELWLANKLEEPWSSERIANLLTSSIFLAIKAKFERMDPIIKLKLLFSLFALRKPNIKQMKTEIEDILKLGLVDSDGWVRSISKLIGKITPDGDFELKTDDCCPAEIYETLKSMVETTSIDFFPLETLYLHPALLEKPYIKANPHFTIKKRIENEITTTNPTPRRSSLSLSSSTVKIEPPSADKSVQRFDRSTDGLPLRSSTNNITTPTRKSSVFAPRQSYDSLSLGERRGFQKTNRTRMLDLGEVEKLRQASLEAAAKAAREAAAKEQALQEAKEAKEAARLAAKAAKAKPKAKESEPDPTAVTVASIVTTTPMVSESEPSKDGITAEGATSPTTPKKVKRRTAETGDGKKTPEPKKRKKTEDKEKKEKTPKEPKQKKEKKEKPPKPEGEKTKRKTKKQKQEEEAQAQIQPQTEVDRQVEQNKMLEAEKRAAEALLGVSSSLPFAAEASNAPKAEVPQPRIVPGPFAMEATIPLAQPAGSSLSSMLSQALLSQTGFTATPTPQAPTPSVPAPAAVPTIPTLTPTLTPTLPTATSLTPTIPTPGAPTIPSITPPSAAIPPAVYSSLFEDTNQLTPKNREIIEQFLSGNRVNPTPEEGPIKSILLNEDLKENKENNTKHLEQIIFEINYQTATWRKLRRKRPVKSGVAPTK